MRSRLIGWAHFSTSGIFLLTSYLGLMCRYRPVKVKSGINWIERRKKAMFKRFTSALIELGIIKAMEHNVQPWPLFIWFRKSLGCWLSLVMADQYLPKRMLIIPNCWNTVSIFLKNDSFFFLIWSHRLTGLGHHPFKVEIGVRVPVGSPLGRITVLDFKSKSDKR